MTLPRLRSLLIATLAACFIWLGGGLWPSPTAWGLGLGLGGARKTGMDISLIPPTAMFVPRRAPLTASLLTRDLSTLRSRFAASGGRADWESFQNSFLADADFNYNRDVKPWLGDDLTLAVTTLDLDRQAANGQQPGYLLAIAVQDAQQAREFLQRYWQRRAADGSELRYERVNGVRLIYSQPSTGTAWGGFSVNSDGRGDRPSDTAAPQSVGLATTSALVGDRFLLFANAPKVIREAVANVQFPALNLASDPDYQRSLAALTAPRIAYAYANLNALGSWLETQGLAVNPLRESTATPLEPTSRGAQQQAPPLSHYQSWAVGLGTTARGLLADIALLSPPQPAAAGTEPSMDAEQIQPDRVLSYLPPDSIAAVSSADLEQIWQGIQPLLPTYPALQTLVDRALDHLQADWKLDITEEIFPWVDGEYGLGQLERPEGTDWVFVVERTSEAAQRGIQHLDDLARKQGYSIGEVTLADREVTAWTSLNPVGEQDSAASAVRAIVRGVHAHLDNYELFSTSLEAMEKVLQSRGGHALTETADFKQAIAPLPPTNQGYFYVNWKDNQTLLKTELPLLRILDLAAQPLFRGLKTVSLSGYEPQPEQGLQRVAIALQLGK